MVWPRLAAAVVVVAMMMTAGRGEEAQNIGERQRLREALLHNYDKENIPSSHKEPLIVTMTDFTIRNLEMHEAAHRLLLHAWASFQWMDKRLVWNPDDYGGIQKITFNPQDLWQPDLTFYNAAASKDMLLVSQTRLHVHSKGEVLNVAIFDLHFSCVANLTYWPHDTHECRLRIGSWVHDGFTIELRVEDFLTSELTNEVTESRDGTMDTLDWEIIGDTVTRNEIVYPCCPEPYINLEVMLRLYRKAPVYNWLIKAPAACLMLLTLVVFVLPPGAGEKITFGGICLLLNLVFIVFTHGTVRNSPSHTPLLVQLVVVQLVVTSASVLIASWVVRAARGPYFSSPPFGVHSFFLILAPALCLSAYVKQIPGKGRVRTRMARKEEMEMGSEVESVVEGEQSGIAAQWMFLGAVLDRIALYLYLIISLILLIKFFCMI